MTSLLSHASAISRHRLLQPQKLLHIHASGSEVAIDYSQVRYTGNYAEIKKLRKGNNVVEKVGALSGKVIPIVDIRSRARTLNPCRNDDASYHDFIVLSLKDQWVGVRIDQVIDILLVPALDIDASATWGRTQADFIVGIVALHNKRLPMIDMQRLLKPASVLANPFLAM